MSSIAAVNNAALDLTKKQTSNTNGTGTNLDKDAFLKLLTAQMKYQDPMKPADQTQQLAQLAQFSSLEQMTNLTKQLSTLASSASADRAIALVGKSVTYTGDKGAATTGTVEKVAFDKDGKPSLTIGGVAGIDPAKISVVM